MTLMIWIKDIDMTITVGGDLTLPGSSTERMLLGDLLELEDDGIIKANESHRGLCFGTERGKFYYFD